MGLVLSLGSLSKNKSSSISGNLGSSSGSRGSLLLSLSSSSSVSSGFGSSSLICDHLGIGLLFELLHSLSSSLGLLHSLLGSMSLSLGEGSSFLFGNSLLDELIFGLLKGFVFKAILLDLGSSNSNSLLSGGNFCSRCGMSSGLSSFLGLLFLLDLLSSKSINGLLLKLSLFSSS
mgnify:FL=1|jgi:hypothetical protein